MIWTYINKRNITQFQYKIYILDQKRTELSYDELGYNSLKFGGLQMIIKVDSETMIESLKFGVLQMIIKVDSRP